MSNSVPLGMPSSQVVNGVKPNSAALMNPANIEKNARIINGTVMILGLSCACAAASVLGLPKNTMINCRVI